jgi:hypothetical protein
VSVGLRHYYMDVTADVSIYFYPVKAAVILKQLKRKSEPCWTYC